MTLLTVVAVIAFIELGLWQWHRAALRHAQTQAFSAGTDRTADLSHESVAALPRYTQVSVVGRLDETHQFLLDNMSHDGQPGYQALTPMQLADGRTVLINRGWLPITQSRSQLPNIALPAHDDTVTLVGRLDNLPVPGIALGHLAPDAKAPWPKITSFPLMSDLAAALGRPVEPRQVLLLGTQPFGFVRDWSPEGLSEARHLSYAIQWWGFAALAVVLYGLLNRRRA